MPKLHQLLSTMFPQVQFQENYPLAELTYFKIGGPAEVYAELAERDHIIEVVRFCQLQKIKFTILGGGSNVVVSDKGIKGLVLNLTNNKVERDKNDKLVVEAEAGVRTALLVKQTVDFKLTGLEYFLGVPGKLGGAVYNNAHYLEDLISEYITRVEIVNKSGQAEWLEKADCEFGYDSSRFQKTSK